MEYALQAIMSVSQNLAQAEANAKALKTGILLCFLKPNTISLRDYQLILCVLEYLNYRAKFAS